MVQKGWIHFTLGSFHVDHDDATLFIGNLGGNSYWFGDWEVDWVQLIPIVREDGFITTPEKNPPKGAAVEADSPLWEGTVEYQEENPVFPPLLKALR